MNPSQQGYSDLISKIVQSSADFQTLKDHNLSRKAAKRLNMQFAKHLDEYERHFVVSGVNFLRTQVDTIWQQYEQGEIVEFETIGPYLANYMDSNGLMTMDNLIPEDIVGVRVAALFRTIFPKSRLVALCDEYNRTTVRSAAEGARPEPFTQLQKENFFSGFKNVLEQVGAIPSGAVQGRDFLLISESGNVPKAERLVELLDCQGYIQEVSGALYFVNPAAENPLHRRFCLRTAQGRWLCETLDAAGFSNPENKTITHLVVLPDYMKAQQDRVWEILRVLGIAPSRHHNLFFDPSQPADTIINNIAMAFAADSGNAAGIAPKDTALAL